MTDVQRTYPTSTERPTGEVLSETMTAVNRDRYGPPAVLLVGTVDRPVAGEGQVLRVAAASVNPLDWLRSVIERRVSLEGVPDAVADVGTGHARAKIVVEVGS